jgi:predicted enzyme related to lactoylglutathione lyase
MMQNTFCWVDIPVVNLERAIQFYSAIFDSTIQKIAEHGCEFGLLPHEQDNVSGCLAVYEDRKPSQNGALIYLNVEGRLSQATQAAEKNGGKVLKEIEQIGPYGHRAIILDTEGNAIALYSKQHQ